MKVGDYVRTDNGCICKVLKYVDISDNDFYVNTDSQYDVIYKSWIVKSSPNIIDLIEDGDIIHYHNEYIDFISPVIIYDDGEIASNLYDSDGYIFLDKEKDKNNIKSIITKEQFSQMEYKVGE